MGYSRIGIKDSRGYKVAARRYCAKMASLGRAVEVFEENMRNLGINPHQNKCRITAIGNVRRKQNLSG
jgi:hypothetical protein